MTCDIQDSQADDDVFRLGHRPDPWRWPEWEWVEATAPLEPEATTAGRWDDPHREYRVLYVARERRTVFLETMAHFEADPGIEAEWALIDGVDDSLAPGQLPREWIERRVLGTAHLSGLFAVATASRSLAWFRRFLGDFARSYGVGYIDAAAIQLSAPRQLTQAISRLIRECVTGAAPQFRGVAYPSRHGTELQCWAVFELADTLTRRASEALTPDDADFQAALQHFSLELV
jgi:hypothetical protein